MPFFTYNQNNSFGSWDFDKERGLTHNVIVEADTPEQANRKAESIGLYFDGAQDCPCCGNRWAPAWDDETGDEVPSLWGTPVGEKQRFESMKWMDEGFETVVHYADGRMVWHG
jgi:hypothetical protein